MTSKTTVDAARVELLSTGTELSANVGFQFSLGGGGGGGSGINRHLDRRLPFRWFGCVALAAAAG